MIALAGDGVEIGNINDVERGERAQAAQNICRAAISRQRRDDRVIVGPIAGTGANDRTVLEVENWYDREGTHFWRGYALPSCGPNYATTVGHLGRPVPVASSAI